MPRIGQVVLEAVVQSSYRELLAVNGLILKRSHGHGFGVVTRADLPLKARIEIKQPEVEGQGKHDG
jgi:hypothetical protein